MVDVFISYRRSQALAADGIYERLCTVFGREKVYLDRSTMKPGMKFPDEIKRALDTAKIVLVIIDRTWISIQDPITKRRRLELEDDWVRIEVERGLAEDKIVIPVLLDKAAMPGSHQLPDALGALAVQHNVRIRKENFAHDVGPLIEHVKAKISELRLQEFLDDDTDLYPPAAEFKPVAIEGDLLETMMSQLPNWQIMESPIEDDARPGLPAIRREIVRKFKFPSFLDAIDFMKSASELIEAFDHHPRWENTYKTVKVALSTWDIGHQLSDRDFNTAIMIERHYTKFIAGC